MALLRLLSPDLRVKPGAGERPVTFGGGHGDPEHLRHLLEGQADEIPQRGYLGALRFLGRQLVEHVVNRQQLVVVRPRRDLHLLELDPDLPAAVPYGALAPGGINQDMPHGRGGGGEEMSATGEAGRPITGQTHPGFMHERGRLEGVAGRLTGHLVGGKLAQLLVNQR